MADESASPHQLHREVAKLKELLAKHQERINQLEQEPAVLPETIEALGLDTPTGRRQAMKYAGVAAVTPAALSYWLSGRARADAVAADVGTQADPWSKGWFHNIGAGDGATEVTFDDPIATEDLTVDGFQGTPIWKEESGSPYTATGASSANSINPSSLDSFEQYLIQAKITDQATSANAVEMQVGGDTGSNYFETLDDGSRNASQTEWGSLTEMVGDATVTLRFILYRELGQPSFTSQTVASRAGGVVAYGLNTNVSWPPGQFTLKRGVDTDWEVRVWGRDV